MSGLYSADRLLNLLAAIDNLPARHDCPGLDLMHDHPTWRVILSPATATGIPMWWAIPPGDEAKDTAVMLASECFPTHAEAIAYATGQARRDLRAVTHAPDAPAPVNRKEAR